MNTIAPEQLALLEADATQADELFVSSWSSTKKAFLEFGRACCMLEDQGLHKYVRKEGSRKGYLSFDEYVDAKTGGDCSRTTIFEAKRVYKLTQGNDPIPTEEVVKMPRKNQLRLANALLRHPDMPAPARKKLVARAASESVTAFAVTATSVTNEQLPAEEQKAPLMRWSRMMDPRAAELLDNTIADFKLTDIVRSVMRDLDQESAAIISICHAAANWAQDHVKAGKDKANREAPVLSDPSQETAAEEHEVATALPAPSLPEEFVADDFATAVGSAEAEHRVVRQKSEARH